MADDLSTVADREIEVESSEIEIKSLDKGQLLLF